VILCASGRRRSVAGVTRGAGRVVSTAVLMPDTAAQAKVAPTSAIVFMRKAAALAKLARPLKEEAAQVLPFPFALCLQRSAHERLAAARVHATAEPAGRTAGATAPATGPRAHPHSHAGHLSRELRELLREARLAPKSATRGTEAAPALGHWHAGHCEVPSGEALHRGSLGIRVTLRRIHLFVVCVAQKILGRKIDVLVCEINRG